MNQTTNTTIPKNGCCKAEFYEMYKPMTVKFLRDEINEIMFSCRKDNPNFKVNSLEDVKKKQYIFPNELKMFVEKYGLAEAVEN